MSSGSRTPLSPSFVRRVQGARDRAGSAADHRALLLDALHSFFFLRDGNELVATMIRVRPLGDVRERRLVSKFAEVSLTFADASPTITVGRRNCIAEPKLAVQRAHRRLRSARKGCPSSFIRSPAESVRTSINDADQQRVARWLDPQGLRPSGHRPERRLRPVELPHAPRPSRSRPTRPQHRALRRAPRIAVGMSRSPGPRVRWRAAYHR